MATLFLMIGLPGAGKTVWARELAARHAALRLSPDAWMIPLFGDSAADGGRDVLEGRLITVALDVLGLGTNVVLDFGLWAREERSALRWLAASVGARSQLVYLPIDRITQLARINQRWTQESQTTFPMTEADVDRWRRQFQVPDAGELSGDEIDDAPDGWASWPDWAVQRWPSLELGGR